VHRKDNVSVVPMIALHGALYSCLFSPAVALELWTLESGVSRLRELRFVLSGPLTDLLFNTDSDSASKSVRELA
jgi:hypothetical protein